MNAQVSVCPNPLADDAALHDGVARGFQADSDEGVTLKAYTDGAIDGGGGGSGDGSPESVKAGGSGWRDTLPMNAPDIAVTAAAGRVGNVCVPVSACICPHLRLCVL